MMDPTAGNGFERGFFRSIVENVPEVIVRYDKSLSRVYANPAIEQIHGMPADEVIGLSIKDSPWPHELISFYEESLKSVFATSLEKVIEYEIPTPEGLKYRRAHLKPELDNNGSVKSVLSVVVDITPRKQAEAKLMASEERLRNLHANMEALREQEKSEIARDIHDDLGQKLLALKMDLAWLKGKINRGQRALIDKASQDIKLVDGLIASVKRINEELRPSLLDHLGLEAALEWLIEGFQNRTGIICKFEFDSKNASLGKEVDLAVFRILQEALNNIFNHAGATKSIIQLTELDGSLTLEISDNGIGITEEQLSKQNSFGIQGIGERVTALKGALSISGVQDRGTVIKISLPPDYMVER